MTNEWRTKLFDCSTPAPVVDPPMRYVRLSSGGDMPVLYHVTLTCRNAAARFGNTSTSVAWAGEKPPVIAYSTHIPGATKAKAGPCNA